MAVWSFIAVLLAALTFAPQDALGHGYMAVPEGRQMCNRGTLGRDGFTKTGGTHKPYFCGWQEQDGTACEPQETYAEGGILTLRYVIRANHGGFLQCRICTDPTNLSEECFDQHILKTVDTGKAWVSSDRWYIREDGVDNGRESPEWGATWVSEWQLPLGLVTDHATVSCIWYTAQQCSLPCDEAACGPFYSQGRNPYGKRGPDFVYDACPEPWELKYAVKFPQTFTNCADIRIQGGGASAPALPLPGSEEEMSEQEQLEVVQEEEDELGIDVSNSGMADDLKCGDAMVASVLLELNLAREENEKPRLECSDRSTGAAANWAYLVAEKGEVSSDRAGNCELSRFEAECLEVVASTDPGADVLLDPRSLPLLSIEATHVGIGYYELNGAVWWTILAGSDGAITPPPAEQPAPMQPASMQPAPALEAAAVADPPAMPASPSAGGSMSRLGSWLNHFHPSI